MPTFNQYWKCIANPIATSVRCISLFLASLKAL